MRFFKITLVTSLFFFVFSFLFFKKEALACETISLLGFEEISPNVYTDDSLTSQQRSLLNLAITSAYDRVEQVYGKAQSPSRIIATNNLSYKKFGLNPTGMQNSAFFRECVFLGPKGLNVDVIAHELVHAEVRYRTNFFVEQTELPAWFIEGTGIKVDYRAPFLMKNIKISEEETENVKSIFFFRDFPNTSVKTYQASRVAIEVLEPKQLYKGLERLNEGESFETVFNF